MTFDVQCIEEDEHTFRAKTGFETASLSGLRVLDAGCGGGRYAHIAGRHGAEVVAVDISQAVEKTASLCRDMPHVDVLQADIMHLPLRPGIFDRVYSIGVLHHTPDTRQAFHALPPLVRPGGHMSVWVYRRWPPFQERMNRFWRSMTTKLPFQVIYGIAVLGSPLGAVRGAAYRSRFRLAARLLWQTEKILPGFSNHPRWRERICGTFDWFSPPYQWHHTEEEVAAWFAAGGLKGIRNLSGACPLYIEGQGDGVCFTGTRPAG